MTEHTGERDESKHELRDIVDFEGPGERMSVVVNEVVLCQRTQSSLPPSNE